MVLPEERQAVVPVEEVVHGVEAVDLHVLLCPVKVVGVGIHAYGGERSAGCCMDCCACRVAEQVQESLVLAHGFYQLAYRSVVQEQSCVQVVAEVHQELVPVLVDHVEVG